MFGAYMLPNYYISNKFTAKNGFWSSKTLFKQIIDKLFLFIILIFFIFTIISNTNISNISPFCLTH